MKFREWFLAEDEMTGTGEFGNQPDPMDNGLYDPQGSGHYRPVPRSAFADKLFKGKGKSFMRSGQKRAKAIEINSSTST